MSRSKTTPATPAKPQGAPPTPIENLSTLLDKLPALGIDADTEEPYVKVYRADPRGGPTLEWCQDYDPVSIDEATIREDWGPGVYEIQIYVRGKRGIRHKHRVHIAAPPRTAAPPPTFRFPTAPAPPEQIPPAPAPSPAAPAAPPDSPSTMLMMLMQQSAAAQQQMTTLLTTMLQHQSTQTIETMKALGSRQERTPGVSELGELFQLLKAMRSDQGGDAADAGGNDMIGLAALATALTELVKTRPAAAAPPRPAAGAPRPQLTAATPAAAHQATPPAAPSPAATSASAEEGPQPIPAEFHIIADILRRTKANSSRRAEAYADMVADLIGDDTAANILAASTQGQVTEALIGAFPDLADQASFIREIESELRHLYPADDAEDRPLDTAAPPADTSSTEQAKDSPK